MPKILIDEANDYGSNNFWFSLSDNGDVANNVVVLLSSLKELPIYALHEIDVNGSKLKISCLRDPKGSITQCPLCQNKFRVSVKMFVPILHDDMIKLWDRGKSFFPILESLFRRHKFVPACTFEVERQGNKNDTNTTYQFHFMSADKRVKSLDDVLADIDEMEIKKLDIVDYALFEWSYDEMIQYLETGNNPKEENKTKSKKNGFIPRNKYNDKKISDKIVKRSTDEEYEENVDEEEYEEEQEENNKSLSKRVDRNKKRYEEEQEEYEEEQVNKKFKKQPEYNDDEDAF